MMDLLMFFFSLTGIVAWGAIIWIIITIWMEE